ncbi:MULTISPECIES: response regulator [Salinibaculum]|uniref:response regulator n=1 Tax=Salinibaculum TaxID=2732368 RepID=UPI0030D0F35C
MTGDDNGSGTRRRTDLPSSTIFEVLADRRRRTVLFHLRQHRAATVDELVDVLDEVVELDTDSSERIAASLVHTHIPKLAAGGLVTYDPDEGVVESVRIHDEIGEWLDLAVRRDIRVGSAAATAAGGDDQGTIDVLLTDDEPGLAEMIAAFIERENADMTVTTAASALEAVSTLKEGSFDCIVSDYQMPAISGLDLLKAVRAEDGSIPFIVFTAKGSEALASEAITTGVTDYVQKGTDPDEYDRLVARIRRAVDQQRNRR